MRRHWGSARLASVRGSSTVGAGTMDAGLRTVQDVFAALRLDDQWSVRSRRGFTWLPDERAQRIWTDEGTSWHGVTVFRVVAETELFAIDEGDRDGVLILSMLGADATAAGLVVENGAVTLRSAVLTYD